MINARSGVVAWVSGGRWAAAVTLALSVATGPGRGASLAADGAVDFNFEIRPLLSDRCYACHGPDDRARKAKLSLHTRDGALAGGRSGQPAIVPGDPAASPLLKRVLTEDVDDRMPPAESKLPALTEVEAGKIRAWITQGAPYARHWSFSPIRRLPPPQPVDPRRWVRNPIDAYVLDRLNQEGLSPQAEASRPVLIRRLSLDLTGLPPTPSEIHAFVAATSADAYVKVVDRLLDSPHHGEQMAAWWLDLARYADTYGYQADVECDLSPWRDWVIRAFNANLPYDQFLTWQLAGDLLPNPTRDQILATAFNRLHRQTNEGGSIEEEFRCEYVADRVNTTGTAMLGLTLECARCHDHKYDPITQRDYYRFAAFFNSIDESGLYSHFTRAIPTPTLALWEGDSEVRHAELLRKIAEAEQRLAQITTEAFPRYAVWRQTHASPDAALPTAVAEVSFERVDGHSTPNAAGTNQVELVDGPVPAPGRIGQALRFSGDNSAIVKGVGVFGRADAFSVSLWLQPTELQHRAVVLHGSRSWTDSGSRGYELVLDQGRPWFALIHFWPGNALAIRAREPLPLGQWSHLAVTYDGSSRAAGLRLYLNGTAIATDVVRDSLSRDIRHRAEWGDAEVGHVQLTLAGRFRDSGFKNGLIDELRVFALELTPLEVRWLAEADGSTPPQLPEPGPSGDDPAFAWYAARRDTACQSALAELHRLRQQEDDLITSVREIMVMRELPERRPAYVLKRGAYDARGERVEPGVPEALRPWPPGLPANRLGLARWLTDPNHPLTARVAVNHFWRMHFGRGLVASAQDFGSQGRLPLYPGLLDWLARRFIDSGWDHKALQRDIVLSATYRQASTASPELLARDPENQCLARGPKHRLSAEAIRDGALAASGLLEPAVGGPSVKPYQPAGVWEEAGTGKTYTQDHGANLYRRSLYTFWRRTAPPPNMLTFDATTREVCTAQRETTTTPIQALVLLNDPQFVEAARVLAEHLVAAYPDDPAGRLAEAFERATGRTPQPREREILLRLFAEQQQYFRVQREAAEQLLATGEHPRRSDLPSADVAPTTVLVSALFNHDEFVMKR